MKNCFTKIAACILVVSMALPLASCKKNESKGVDSRSSSGKKIEADTPWFDSRILKIDQGIDPNRSVDVLDQTMLGCDDEKIIKEITNFVVNEFLNGTYKEIHLIVLKGLRHLVNMAFLNVILLITELQNIQSSN